MVRLNYQARQIFFWRKKFHYFLNPRETTFFVYNRTHSWRYVLPSGVVKIDDISFRAGSSRFGSCASLFGFRNSCTYKVSIRGGWQFLLIARWAFGIPVGRGSLQRRVPPTCAIPFSCHQTHPKVNSSLYLPNWCGERDIKITRLNKKPTEKWEITTKADWKWVIFRDNYRFYSPKFRHA